MREGESDEIKVELEFFEEGGLVVLGGRAVFLYDSGHFIVEKRLLIEGSLLDGLVKQGKNLLNVSG